MTNALNNGLDSLQGTLQSEQFKKILPYLLIGGAGAGAGALMTGGRRKNKRNPESRMGYLGRVLRNALATGGLTAGIAGAASYGANKLSDKPAVDGKQAPGLDNPTDQALRSTLFSPVTALGAGAAGLAATHKIPWIGANTGPRDDMRKAIAGKLGIGDNSNPNVSALMAMDPKDLGSKLQGHPNIDGVATDKARRLAGLTVSKRLPKGSLTDLNLGQTLKNIATSPSSAKSELLAMKDRLRFSELGDAATRVARNPKDIMHEYQMLKTLPGFNYRKGQLSEFGSRFTRRGLSTLGQTGGRRALRGGVGLAAAAIPALIGAFATEEKPN